LDLLVAIPTRFPFRVIARREAQWIHLLLRLRVLPRLAIVGVLTAIFPLRRHRVGASSSIAQKYPVTSSTVGVAVLSRVLLEKVISTNREETMVRIFHTTFASCTVSPKDLSDDGLRILNSSMRSPSLKTVFLNSTRGV
jgi:hypothetical protein